MTATEGMDAMAEMVGEVDTRFLCLFKERVAGALGREGRFQLVQHSEYLEDRPGQRRTYELDAPQAGIVMQARGRGLGSRKPASHVGAVHAWLQRVQLLAALSMHVPAHPCTQLTQRCFMLADTPA